MTSAISIQNICVSVGHKNLIENISIEIPAGRITTIIGPNGCGKSTTLKAVCRLMPFAAGKILVLGKEVKEYTFKEFARKVAILTQAPLSPADLTVRDLVAMGRFPYRGLLGGSSKEDDACIAWALQETALENLSTRLLSTLSGGERQRAWIAMALAQKPEILLLDEPTTYLDICHQLEVLKLLKKLNRELHLTVVLVLHDLNQALMFSDYVAVIKAGHLVTAGDPRKIIKAELLQTVFQVQADTFTCTNGLQALVPMDLYVEEKE
jgi:iron complex transport system ATP-binding protein